MLRRDLVANLVIIVIALTVIYTISVGSSTLTGFAVFNTPDDSNQTTDSNETTGSNQTDDTENISLSQYTGPPDESTSDIMGKDFDVPLPPVNDPLPDKIESMVTAMPYVSLLGDTDLCIIINTANGPLSYNVAQTSLSLNVTKSGRFCDGVDLEDFIISFSNEDIFNEYTKDPVCSQFVSGVGSDYYVLPSRYIEEGGNIICNSYFKDRFCDSFAQCVSSDELIEADLSCCLIGELTHEQRVLLKQHLASGRYVDETGTDLSDIKLPGESDSIIDTLIGGGNSLIKWILFVVILGAVGAGAFFFFIKPKMETEPEEEIDNSGQLHEYFRQTLEQGYTFGQIKQALLEQGWPEDIIDKEMASYYTKMQSSSAPNQGKQTQFNTGRNQQEYR